MKILLVNTHDAGGAANACLRLHEGLMKQNQNSSVLVLNKQTKISKRIFQIEKKPQYSLQERLLNKYNRIYKEFKLPKLSSPLEKEKNYLNQLNKHRPKGLDMFSLPNSRYDITENQFYKDSDIINLHWVANFLDFPSFFKKNKKPIVWTLHDQSPFLGGEHYQGLLYGIKKDGTPIERVYSDKELQEEKRHLETKRKALEKVENIHIVCPSKWLLKSSKSSTLFKNYKHHYIPYGFPTDVFRPYNRSFAIEILNLPQDKIVLLFVADGLTNGRKGFAYLQRAMENVLSKNAKNIFLCTVGNGKLESNSINKKLINLGSIQDERIMALAYSAADVFVIPSLEDNLPNTMIESILCGTPVIGFPIGGIPDAIKDSQNGYLCEEISVNSLEANIRKFIDNPTFFDREKIATEAKEKYALEVQAKKYIELYQSILDNH